MELPAPLTVVDAVAKEGLVEKPDAFGQVQRIHKKRIRAIPDLGAEPQPQFPQPRDAVHVRG